MEPFAALSPTRLDRAAGALVGLAAGDALGAGYDLAAPPPEKPAMLGGGLGDVAPGEWTDDTRMAICVAEVTATGSVDPAAIGDRFLARHANGPADVGIRTRAAGGGSLMPIAPVALAALGDDDALGDLVRRVSALTHGDPLAGQACALWCVAIDRAVRESRLDGIHDAVARLPPEWAAFWRERVAEAEHYPPSHFAPNGCVATALQAAHAAIVQTPVPRDQPGRHLERALHAAVRASGDTDTVAAITGQLVGARWGVSAVPFHWRRQLHGWPGYRCRDLVRLAVLTAQGGTPTPGGWPVADALLPAYAGPHAEPAQPAALPSDHGVELGPITALAGVDADAVISLCRVGPADVPPGAEHLEVLLVDEAAANPNLAQVLDDTADAIAALRAEGKRVFVHCVACASRTPTVAARHLVRHHGLSPAQALDEVEEIAPHATPNPAFLAELERSD